MRDDLDDYRIPWHLDDEPCEVYLFRRWGSYSHPILPLDPLSIVESCAAPSLCRAYVQDIDGEPHMVRFACHSAHTRFLDLADPPVTGVYALVTAADGSVGPGVLLRPAEAAMADGVLLVEHSSDGPRVSTRELTWAYTFEYNYDASGALRTYTVANPDGRRTLPA